MTTPIPFGSSVPWPVDADAGTENGRTAWQLAAWVNASAASIKQAQATDRLAAAQEHAAAAQDALRAVMDKATQVERDRFSWEQSRFPVTPAPIPAPTPAPVPVPSDTTPMRALILRVAAAMNDWLQQYPRG